ncbi:MAG TPA: YetF domain-containing protein, partial [Blastocatellia bacterium]
LVEGDLDVLIEDGQVLKHKLKKELITLAELETAAHKQGFDSLDEVQRAILEPGGIISFIAKKPVPEEVRQRELTARLDQIVTELAALRGALPQPQQQS